jgi:hypothetical protein
MGSNVTQTVCLTGTIGLSTVFSTVILQKYIFFIGSEKFILCCVSL